MTSRVLLLRRMLYRCAATAAHISVLVEFDSDGGIEIAGEMTCGSSADPRVKHDLEHFSLILANYF